MQIQVVVLAVAFAVTACFVQQPDQQTPPPYQGQQGQGPNQSAYGQGGYGQQQGYQQPPDGQQGGYAGNTVPNQGLQNGQYACSFKRGTIQYPAMVCIISTRRDGTMTLDKVSGSQRIRGQLYPSGQGYEFDGMLHCPWGSCTETARGTFVVQGDAYVANIQHGATTMEVRLWSPPGGVGGMAYGGGAYGGMRYGGPRL
jgi:hypothetical protein